jgi:hypothetical protein
MLKLYLGQGPQDKNGMQPSPQSSELIIGSSVGKVTVVIS